MRSDRHLDSTHGCERREDCLRDPQLRRCAPPKQITGRGCHHGHIGSKFTYPSGDSSLVDPFGLGVENLGYVADTGQQCVGVPVFQR